jgi:NAD+ kinase
MSSSAGSSPPSAERGRVARAAVVTHGRAEQVGDGVERLVALARRTGVGLIVTPDEAAQHGLAASGSPADAELVVVLGGDGTMLRALRMYLGTGVPVLGVNFGRVGFLSSMQPDQLEEGLARAFSGDFVTVELPTLEVEVEPAAANGEAVDVAVNDVVVTSGELGRMVELEWAVGGEDLGLVPCDGIICSTPSGSTAYNLSNGGPVLMWGIDALATTFVAPHSLHARPLVVPRGKEVVIWNRTTDVPVVVLVDGHRVGEARRDGRIAIRLGDARSLLATLPEATFVRRYRESFST